MSSWKAGAGIPILTNCFVGRLPKLRCEKRRRGKEVTHVPADLTVFTPPSPLTSPSARPERALACCQQFMLNIPASLCLPLDKHRA